MKYRTITIILTGILLGFLFLLQVRSFGGVQNLISRDSRENVFREIQILKTTNENLQDEITDLEGQLAKASNQEEALKGIQDEINKDQVIAGHVNVTGPGIGFTVKNNVQAIWLTDITNELWSAGAEAVSVNNIRLTNSTAGFDTLPNGQISLNGSILSLPYTFLAIGDSKTLMDALSQPAGIIQRLKESIPNIDVSLEQRDGIIMENVL